MSGHSYEASCPNCNSSMNCYTDHKPFDNVSGTCINCGFQFWTQSSQMTLSDLNELRENYNEDNDFKSGDEDYIPILTKLPVLNNALK